MRVEKHEDKNKFERLLHREIERKFIPLFPERLDQYRNEARPLEQYYLSHPDEAFSLRFRELLDESGVLRYEATLKDSGHLTPQGIDRLEVTATVDEALYRFYQDVQTPIIRKLRAEPLPGITIDYYDDGYIQLESEDPEQWEKFLCTAGDQFIDLTGDTTTSNEWRAHISFRRMNDGQEALRPALELKPDDIVRDIMAQYGKKAPVVVHIGGRSGSGKSTIVAEVQRLLEQYHISSEVLSTDDYHRGTTSLTAINNGEPWEHWDDPIVYDTTAMATDLANLYSGQAIYRRTIDWTIVEPVLHGGVIEPRDVVIIEGIYARSHDITNDDDLSYEMTTPLATCIGRRLLRDMRERPEFADPKRALPTCYVRLSPPIELSSKSR
jgi:uridine kinase